MYKNQWDQEAVKVHINWSCGHESTILSPGVADPAGLYGNSSKTPGLSDDERLVSSFQKCWECRESVI